MNLLLAAGIIGLILTLAAGWVLWKVASPARVRGVDPEWLQNFSIAGYRPMERLLSEEDIEFLRAQRGYEPGMDKALRAGRRRLFRLYLRSLALDFNRLHLALRLALLDSPADRPDLGVILIKQKLVFFAALAAVHARLLLHTLGIGTVDVRGLVSTLERMRVELRSLVPAAAIK
jgi:hypothetical protein